jgi:BirA family biotin operon repressor/biotin-[acetyl-CoA-carboxylase] ligase
MAPVDALFLSLITGIATAHAIEQTTGLHPDLRWPNDLMLHGKKICGILTEMNAEPTRVRYVVLGIGINVNQTREELPLDARPEPASLRTLTGSSHDVAALLGLLLFRLERLYDSWLHGGLGDIYAELGSRNFLFGRRVRVDGRTGTAGAIGRDGHLDVHLDGGETLRVESGEIEFDR